MLIFAIAAVAAGSVTVTASPAEIFIERGALQQLNFDFMIDNQGETAVELRKIEMSVFDPRGNLVFRRDVDRSGAAPAIDTVGPDREVAARSRGIIFNPFTTFAANFPLGNLHYRLTFSAPKSDEPIEREVVVRPKPWVPATKLSLPVAGRLWAKHGHDYLAHHRRWNPLHPIARSFGATAIFARYALDLEVVDAKGNARKSGANRNDDYYGWGAAVLAPGAGRVVAAYDGDADDDLATGKSAFDPERLPKEPMHFYGNYVVIDHGNREFSVLGHLKQGSVTVKAGDAVTRGQPVAALGTSGSAEFEPHLHYELRRGLAMSSEGLPAYFRKFTRAGSPVPVTSGPVDAGEIVQSTRR